MFEYSGLKIYWLGHDCFKIRDRLTVYTDPYKIQSDEKADLILITHNHIDHLSLEDIQKISTPNTTIVTNFLSKKKLQSTKVKDVIAMNPGEEFIISGVKVNAIPAYNTDKFREPGIVFHPKADKNLGFILTINGVKIYHLGDTDFIPEMKDVDVDISLVPVSGTYVMTSKEAAKAVDQIKTKIAIPMHYGSGVGNEKDAENFKGLASCEVHILNKE